MLIGVLLSDGLGLWLRSEEYMERCKTCKHWTPEDPEGYNALPGFGECGKAPQIWDVSDTAGEEQNWEGPRHLKSEHAAVLAVVEDGSAYSARLVTAADFGCVQHEQA